MVPYISLSLLPLLVVVSNAQLFPRPRQASSVPVAAASSAPLASVTGASIPLSNGTAAPNASSPPTFPISIPSTNPTAVPLTSLVASPSSQATVALDTSYAAGATPTAVAGAPPLPDISALNPANYPPLDKPPPIDTPEVQAWIAQACPSDRSPSPGFTIPNFSPTQLGGCPTNPSAVTDPNRCWWTCSQCIRSTDIITCPDKNTWGSSFDDGPSPYTPSLIQYLDQESLKTTFFVVGSRVISRPDYLRSQYMGGHQIAVHTWSHTALTTQTTEEIIAEFGWSKKVIKDVLGVTPNVFRPPFGDIDDRVRAIAAAMELKPIIWTSGTASNHVSFDTNDFNIPAGTVSASGVINNFNNILKNASIIDTGFIVLEHDLFQQSVDLATGYIIPEALAMKLTLKPIISCLNMPLSDAYIETNDNGTNPLPTAVGTLIVGSTSTQSAGSASATASSSKGNGAAAIGVSGSAIAAAQVFLMGVLGSVAAF
ncbi:hypothetical protein JB92DRAFT_2766089 [Gautieria morchelliformis]|nr:hypothetical protein JB92DRAFT_2766089 [Gautieria morchelliformis]